MPNPCATNGQLKICLQPFTDVVFSYVLNFHIPVCIIENYICCIVCLVGDRLLAIFAFRSTRNCWTKWKILEKYLSETFQSQDVKNRLARPETVPRAKHWLSALSPSSNQIKAGHLISWDIPTGPNIHQMNATAAHGASLSANGRRQYKELKLWKLYNEMPAETIQHSRFCASPNTHIWRVHVQTSLPRMGKLALASKVTLLLPLTRGLACMTTKVHVLPCARFRHVILL